MKRVTTMLGHQAHVATTCTHKDERILRKMQPRKRNQRIYNRYISQKKPYLLLINWKKPPLLPIQDKNCAFKVRILQ